MLKIIIEGEELFDEETSSFHTVDDVEVELEHSLLSLSKWEAKHQKPFLAVGQKTPEEILDYVMSMIITPVVSIDFVKSWSNDVFNTINDYINSPQSATTFGLMPDKRGPNEVITSELIYYWLVAFNIPFECENWHINRLFSLIRICNIKNAKPKRMSKHEIAQRNQKLNAKRRAELGTTG